MRLQRMLGHLTTLIPTPPRDVLVIACGAGVTAGAVSVDPRVEHLTIAEIEPLVPQRVAPLFAHYNHNVVRNPKVHVELDDARHFLTTTKQTFDAITSDPFDPWVKGAANLYTREFWELAKRHLKPGGVVTVFVQLYDSGMAAVKSEVATFFEAFPQGIVWDNSIRGQGYDVVLMGQAGPTRIDVDALEALLTRPEMAPVAESMADIGFDSALTLMATYVGRASDLAPWLKDAEINRDDNLRLQFLAGFGMNIDERNEIHRAMFASRQYPEGLFTGSPANLKELREAIAEREILRREVRLTAVRILDHAPSPLRDRPALRCRYRLHHQRVRQRHLCGHLGVRGAVASLPRPCLRRCDCLRLRRPYEHSFG